MVAAGSVVEYIQRKGIVLSVKGGECLIWTKDSYGRETVETAAIDKVTETGYQAGLDKCMAEASRQHDYTQIEKTLNKVSYISPNRLTKLTYLAIAHILPDGTKDASCPEYMRIVDILEFINRKYGESYKTGTRETIRKTAIKELLHMGMICDNKLKKQSPKFGYKLQEPAESNKEQDTAYKWN